MRLRPKSRARIRTGYFGSPVAAGRTVGTGVLPPPPVPTECVLGKPTLMLAARSGTRASVACLKNVGGLTAVTLTLWM